MKKIALSISLFVLGYGFVNAQTSSKDSTLQFSGSADVYYMYDFAESKTNHVVSSTYTDGLVGTQENTIGFGSLDLKVKKDFNKVSVVGELNFGPRSNDNTYAFNNAQFAYYIQNLYFSYQALKQLSFSAGAMYKYETYEKLTPVDNFNYLMSNGFIEMRKVPFRSVGIRGTYTFSDKVSLTAGLYNTINNTGVSTYDVLANATPFGLSDFAAQLFVNPINDLQLSAAVWVEGQKKQGTHLNFQAHYKLNKGLKLGLDVNNYSGSDTVTQAANNYSNYTSAALYAQQSFSKIFTLGLRFEHENKQENNDQTTYNTFTKDNYNIITLTGSEKVGGLMIKQEIKYDMTDKNNFNTPYLNKDSNPTNKDVEFVLAAIYKF